jgi:hypothetical protein
MKFIDRTGHKYGKLTVTSFSHMENGRAVWNCVCDCGKQAIVRGNALQRKNTRSCGCLFSTLNGKSKRSEYTIWRLMKYRCLDKGCDQYHNYGGRGITICKQWIDSYECFLSDMGPRPSRQYTLDRIDNNGKYEPGNCRWATRKEQANNTSTNKWITFNGKTATVTQWADSIGLKASILHKRLSNKWPIDVAILTPKCECRFSSTNQPRQK